APTRWIGRGNFEFVAVAPGYKGSQRGGVLRCQRNSRQHCRIAVRNAAARKQTARSHSAHNLERVMVYYRWHPCFGLSLPVRRRSKHREGERIYCETPNGRICVLPNWMLSLECSHLSLGSPLVSVEALLDLHHLLVAWQAPLLCDKASLTPTRKEGCVEEISETAQSADESVALQPASDDYSRRQAG